ncbi:glycosyltransferase family 1 protein [Seonamhaeicola sp. ML3]|uniref:glycosyltransferase family 4 protein n=1 Tax=Seonamhaeicola sp. ML3 TaxID=2937786 RepID=UPI00200DD8EC|nr:glycosyltransferase family 1 protein [Seonamhaeicola sp. ML3]
MNIGIEGQRLFRKNKHGMDMVALELIKSLQVLDKENQYYVFVKPDEDSSVLKETSNFKIVKIDSGPYPVWEQYALTRAAKKYNCDILHCTSNTAPLFGSTPLITTVHDIIYLERKSLKILTSNATRYQKMGNMYRKLVVPYAVKKSKRVITVSDFEIKQISYFFGFSGNNKLRSIYNGVSEHFRVLKDETELLEIKEKYGLPDKYIFFLGNTVPKKNTKGTLKAFSRFIAQTNSDYKLVISDFSYDHLEKLLVAIGNQELINHIVLTGYVVNTDLPAIYSQSSLFLYTSLRESFGLPMLEAMACGTPVISSNTSSIPEVAGDAAHLVNPFEPQEIADGIVKVLNDEKYRKKLVSSGLERSKVFSWKNMANQVLDLYKETYEEINA